MSKPSISNRFKGVLERRQIQLSKITVDRETIDDVCEEFGINVLEKAYIVGLDPRLIFSSDFIKGITFLELNRNEDNFAIWQSILKIK
ncbi:MAG: hypothetical protein ABIM99_01700 [Candidatus Dojkabacteria bacterium]